MRLWVLGRAVALLAPLVAGACVAPEPKAAVEVASPREAACADDEPGHEHQAPHGGLLVELGDEFAHVELVFDTSRGTLTAYVLDADAETGVRISQSELRLRAWAGEARPSPLPLVLQAVGNPLTGETPGDSSQFIGPADGLRGVSGLEGLLDAVEIKGVTFEQIAFRGPIGAKG